MCTGQQDMWNNVETIILYELNKDAFLKIPRPLRLSIAMEMLEEPILGGNKKGKKASIVLVHFILKYLDFF